MVFSWLGHTPVEMEQVNSDNVLDYLRESTQHVKCMRAKLKIKNTDFHETNMKIEASNPVSSKRLPPRYRFYICFTFLLTVIKKKKTPQNWSSIFALSLNARRQNSAKLQWV